MLKIPDVETKVEILEEDGVDRINRDHLRIKNHWNYGYLCVLVIKGARYTVDAETLRRAIKNATD